MTKIANSASLRRLLALLLVLPVLAVSAAAQEIGDTVSSSQQTVIENVESVILPGCVKEGFLFLGWNTQKDGSGTHYNVGDTYILSGEATLYGQWQSLAQPEEETQPGEEEMMEEQPAPETQPEATEADQPDYGDLVPGISVALSQMPDLNQLTRQIQEAAPEGKVFAGWHLITGEIDEVVSPEALEARLESLCGPEAQITLIALYGPQPEEADLPGDETLPGETVSETTPVTAAETVPETTAETVAETVPETVGETVSETTGETVPETTVPGEAAPAE